MSESFEKPPQPMDNLESAQRAIMSAEEYAGIEHDKPYIYEVESKGKKVTYFGAGHSWDPTNPAWDQLKEEFTEAAPTLVLVEGMENIQGMKQQIIESAGKYSEEDVINRAGEVGLALKLAVEKGADFDSPEPPFNQEVRSLEQQGLSKESIFAFYIFRGIPQWQQRMKKEEFKEHIQKEIAEMKEVTQWEDFDYSYENLERINHQLYSEGINVEDPNYYKDKVDPIPWAEKRDQQNEISRVARASSRFRDEYMIGKIASHLKEHDNIFIVFGSSHAVMQEPAIRKLMESQ